MLRYFIDLLTTGDIPAGSGPITTATNITITKRLDKAGSFSFDVPSNEPQIADMQPRRMIIIWWIEAGIGAQELTRGVIDKVEPIITPSGVIWRVGGDDLIRELVWTSPGFINLASAGSPITQATALTMLETYTPTWQFVAEATPPNDSVYFSTSGESNLTLLGKVAEQCGDHWYAPLNYARQINYISTFTDSGIRAISPGLRSEPETGICFIVDLREIRDSYDLISRIYPHGERTNPGVFPSTFITLLNCNRTLPSGYTINQSANWIRNDAAETAYGIVVRYVQYSEIKALSGGATDQQSASNALYDVALRELQERSNINYNYRVELAGCSDLLSVGTTIRIVYRRVIDGVVILNIDDDFNILETTTRLLPNQAAQTVGLVISTAYRPPLNEADWAINTEKNRQLK